MEGEHEKAFTGFETVLQKKTPINMPAFRESIVVRILVDSQA